MDEIGDAFGKITAEWFGEEISDLNYTFDDDPESVFISRANHLSNIYNKTGDDMVSGLIAFAANQKKTFMDIPLLDLYEQMDLAKKANQTTHESPVVTQTPRRRVVLAERNMGRYDNDTMDVDMMDVSAVDGDIELTLPPEYINFAPIRSAPSNTVYQNRKNSGKIAQIYAGKLFNASQGEHSNEIQANVEFDKQEQASLLRFGNEKDAEQIEEICLRIDALSEAIRAEHDEIGTFESCDFISSDPFIIGGQIIDESGERLEMGGCSIRATDDTSSMVHLDLNLLNELSLFPGKVVALKGTNETGSMFVATQIFEPVKMQLASIKRQPQMDRLVVWCAAGPFTSNDTLSYEQLCDLLNLAKKHQPHILILMGPFVDRTSAAALSPNLSMKHDELLERLLVNISNMMQISAVQVLLIPNCKKDATVLPMFPTAPMQISTECKKELNENVLFGTDPCQLKIGGVEFALSNTEVMQVMSRDEIHKSPTQENEDRMARIAGHLLRQRSLYPLYPPPLDIAQKTVETIKRCALKNVPHVMVMPSMLAPMVKVVDGCVCINPGMLARGQGGTFMKMQIDLTMLGIEPGEQGDNCSVAECCHVEVVRI